LRRIAVPQSSPRRTGTNARLGEFPGGALLNHFGIFDLDSVHGRATDLCALLSD